MSGKGKGKGTPKKASRQQQQQDAARRRAVPAPGNRGTAQPTGQPGRPVRDVSLAATAAATANVPTAGPAKHYVDVAAVRIQDWLGRTPDARFRRGASILLSEVTARGSLSALLPAGVGWNDEAGNVSGVVALVAIGESGVGEDSDEVGPRERLEAAARAIARRMRERMPQCAIQAVTGSGTSYAEVYPGMARARREGDFLLDWPPAPPELFLAKPCDECRQAVATHPDIRVTKEDRYALCEECHARFESAGWLTGNERSAPEVERRLLAALRVTGMDVAGLSDTAAEMAAAGRLDRDDTPSQIALVFADGNRVGAFLSRAAGLADGPTKSEIAPALDQAVLGALAAAVRNRFAGWSRPPVTPHLAGGDDVLVSVPAADAWLFVLTLLTEFGSQLDAATSAWPDQIREDLPSLSAGLVFHHVTHPFSDAVRLVRERLREAKTSGNGPGAAVSFLDLTADGSQPPPDRDPLTLGYLVQNADRFQCTADLPNSRRATLLDLARKHDPAEFAARLTDFDTTPLWEFAVGPGASAQQVRDTLRQDRDKRAEVRRALDVARHWHADPRKEGDQ